jgi:hypothetical protein
MGIGTPSIHNKIPRPIAVSLRRHCRLVVVSQRPRLTVTVKQCATRAKGPLGALMNSSIADRTHCKCTRQTCRAACVCTALERLQKRSAPSDSSALG